MTDKQKQRLDEARSTLSQGLQHIEEDPDALAAYLRFRARFRRYSPTNTVLLQQQRPTAKCCMGYRAWQQHGRQVRKGEKGLMIFAPLLTKPTKDEVAAGADPDERVLRGYRITYVFDYEQTEATSEDALMYESPIPRLGEEGYEELFDALQRVADGLGYRIVRTDGYADGYCSYSRRELGVREALATSDAAAVLAHELAHAIAHEDVRISKAEAELQAEGAAYMACYALGLDTGRIALPYLKGYAEAGGQSCAATGGEDSSEAGRDGALLAQLGAIEAIAERLLEAVQAQQKTLCAA